ncbi:beta-lactamase regulating signal transducer with metallopeptidase domain [Clostridium pascui]|uniref:M48 family metalloprotease n=1 Tax=Clostridium pascui TaxID=46609 RepID=UPI00195A3290|nr:M48 family metalloprotease [Clostridium pascui]MBM7870707.1 beta-lactamase regulating signal transducer with metallopeptidase domain [Clostridium pascui]
MKIQKIYDVHVVESGGILNIIAHELAHIKRNHIIKQTLILPAMWIPFLGETYSKSCEYTCDRMAANYSLDDLIIKETGIRNKVLG